VLIGNNMKKDSIKISTFVFVTFSLSAFVVVSFLFIFLSSKIKYAVVNSDSYSEETRNIRYEENAGHDDPFLTKASTYRRTIAGPIISNFDPYIGNLESPIKIIVYSDFTCPYCYEQERVIKKVIDKYGESVRFIWKDYPELDIESMSFRGAVAARCAQEQDAFWLFHDRLFAKKGVFDEEDFIEIGKNIGLNIGKFNVCIENYDTQKLILDNVEEANALGIIGVPNVYVNDREFIGNVSEKDFSLIIDNELKANE